MTGPSIINDLFQTNINGIWKLFVSVLLWLRSQMPHAGDKLCLLFYRATQNNLKTWLCGKCRERRETFSNCITNTITLIVKSLNWCRIGCFWCGEKGCISAWSLFLWDDEVEDRTRAHLINCKQFRAPELAPPYLIPLLHSDTSSQWQSHSSRGMTHLKSVCGILLLGENR